MAAGRIPQRVARTQPPRIVVRGVGSRPLPNAATNRSAVQQNRSIVPIGAVPSSRNPLSVVATSRAMPRRMNQPLVSTAESRSNITPSSGVPTRANRSVANIIPASRQAALLAKPSPRQAARPTVAPAAISTERPQSRAALVATDAPRSFPRTPVAPAASRSREPVGLGRPVVDATSPSDRLGLPAGDKASARPPLASPVSGSRKPGRMIVPREPVRNSREAIELPRIRDRGSVSSIVPRAVGIAGPVPLQLPTPANRASRENVRVSALATAARSSIHPKANESRWQPRPPRVPDAPLREGE